METLEYTVIANKRQYNEYCGQLAELLDMPESKAVNQRIDLLTALIEKWDDEHNTFDDLNPVELLEALMEQHHLKATRLADILDVSKGLVSDILKYKKGFSKEVIRKLAEYFKVTQEAFNRPYNLQSEQAAAKIILTKKPTRELPIINVARATLPGGLGFVFDRKKKPSSHIPKRK